MRREPQWIQDALVAASEIIEFTRSMDLAGFEADKRTRYAVERSFITIAAALVRLRDHAPELARQIPRLQRIVDFRNFLAHEYDKVDPEEIWESVQYDLPELQHQLQSLLAAEKKPDPDDSPDFGPGM